MESRLSYRSRPTAPTILYIVVGSESKGNKDKAPLGRNGTWRLEFQAGMSFKLKRRGKNAGENGVKENITRFTWYETLKLLLPLTLIVSLWVMRLLQNSVIYARTNARCRLMVLFVFFCISFVHSFAGEGVWRSGEIINTLPCKWSFCASEQGAACPFPKQQKQGTNRIRHKMWYPEPKCSGRMNPSEAIKAILETMTPVHGRRSARSENYF